MNGHSFFVSIARDIKKNARLGKRSEQHRVKLSMFKIDAIKYLQNISNLFDNQFVLFILILLERHQYKSGISFAKTYFVGMGTP